MKNKKTVYRGHQPMNQAMAHREEGFVEIDGDLFYKIENYHAMAPFFMTICSDSNHWMFISSTGGLSAGRVNSESALFPYYTDDRVAENAENTGPSTHILVSKTDGKSFIWKPFSKNDRQLYKISSALYKNTRGNKILFEETNEDLGISFSYSWMNSRKFGWVRQAAVKNLSSEDLNIEVVDGLKNIIPAGTSSKEQNLFSNLLNAYKKSEIDGESGMGLFALSATLTDLAEPSESLRSHVVWTCGIPVDHHFLNEKQIESFYAGEELHSESELKGERGNYFINSSFPLLKGAKQSWYICADVDLDHSAVNNLKAEIRNPDFDSIRDIEEDVEAGCKRLDAILEQNDGSQSSNVQMNTVHHRANVMYNIMRGGYFTRNYSIDTKDLLDFFKSVNSSYSDEMDALLNGASQFLDYNEIDTMIDGCGNEELKRIWYEYLPLSFSRRHGDPSRPWNIFSIETEKEDGSPKLEYQGNWRDIFQNWEALTYSYPLFIKNVIGKFLNATTADGYNPYRISRKGIDWEVPEPGNPWANIGYWSDHQIIYLLKMLELHRHFNGDELKSLLNQKSYTFADVPYEIKPFEEILKDPYNTIDFNWTRHNEIMARAEKIGADGKMIHLKDGSLAKGTMTEKLLILLMAKLSNFIPGGGIWMNTQRPEWNDANNALVGKGISVVTLAYVRRYLSFLIDLFEGADSEAFDVAGLTAQWFSRLKSVFAGLEKQGSNLDEVQRYSFVKELGIAAEEYRTKLYKGSFGEEKDHLSSKDLIDFFRSVLSSVDETLSQNVREDKLYHSYNTLEVKEGRLIIHYLYEMLEGQVAILSSGYLKAEEVATVLEAMEKSALYRKDQNSYMLYPDRELPGYMEKNNIDTQKIEKSGLLSLLVKEDNRELISKDKTGQIHFHGDFKNIKQVHEALDSLAGNENYKSLVESEREGIARLFELTFNHQSFTGRSGTFFAFEGLGSIYWHMVSKLLLAVQENYLEAFDKGENKEILGVLKKHYYAVRSGIGYNKNAQIYGAFPFEPYSHTPGGKGARQPGMTGQVKEEVITRFAEMGLRIVDGQISFSNALLDEEEWHVKEESWKVVNSAGKALDIALEKGSLGASFCQTPYRLSSGKSDEIAVYYSDGTSQVIKNHILDKENSEEIYNRSGKISWLDVKIQM